MRRNNPAKSNSLSGNFRTFTLSRIPLNCPFGQTNPIFQNGSLVAGSRELKPETCTNEPNLNYQPRLQKSFFAKQTQFQKPAKCPNSFSYSWLLEAGGWRLDKKQTQTKPFPQTDNWLLMTENGTNEPNFHLSSRPKGIRTFSLFPLPFDRVLPNEANFVDGVASNG
jgi:hypothetical protein